MEKRDIDNLNEFMYLMMLMKDPLKVRIKRAILPVFFLTSWVCLFLSILGAYHEGDLDAAVLGVAFLFGSLPFLVQILMMWRDG